MKTLKDCFGHSVRLTDERLAHILEHPESRYLPGMRRADLSRRSNAKTEASGCGLGDLRKKSLAKSWLRWTKPTWLNGILLPLFLVLY
jgi:hypothetical protein